MEDASPVHGRTQSAVSVVALDDPAEDAATRHTDDPQLSVAVGNLVVTYSDVPDADLSAPEVESVVVPVAGSGPDSEAI